MKFPPPLRVAIPLLLLLFSAAAGGLSHYYDLLAKKRDIERDVTEQARFLGTKLAAMSAYFIENGSAVGAQREIALTATSPDLRMAFVLNATDKVLFSTRYEAIGLPLAKTHAAKHSTLINRARASTEGFTELVDEGAVLAGVFPFPINAKDRQLEPTGKGLIFLEYDLARQQAQARAADIRRLQFGGGTLLALCALFALFFHKTLTSRVSRLVAASGKLAEGDLSVRVALPGSDELTKISLAFDEMAGRLQRRETALSESEQRFRQMADNVEEIFWLYDFTLAHVLYVNPAFERIFGRPTADLIETTDVWKNAIHPDDRERAFAAFAREREASRDIEYRILRPDGSVRWLRDVTFPIQNPDGSITRVAGVTEDITGRRADAEEKAALENKLQETQRLESLGVLAGGIAHDFNNLLTGVMGNASLARMVLPPTDDAQKYLAEIEAVALRAADLCKQMLAYSGKGRFEVQLLDLSALVKETTQLLQLSIAKTASLHFNLSDNFAPILADPTQLRQVVMNLVINASEALGGKAGTISLQTTLLHVDADYLESTVLASELTEGDYACLEISDNGEGMSAETQARIFDPFFTTKFTGRGLGLSAVLGIVRGHKGALKVYSELGKGTLFKLLFPVAKGEAKPLHQETVSRDDWRGSGTILIVDDEETVRTVVSRILESSGFKVITANDGQEAIDRFITARSEIVAVLMDLTMPNVDGEEAFRHLRLLQPDVRVLLMSGFNEQEAINRFIGKGLAGFLQKPFKPAHLRAKLRETLG